MNLWLRNEVDPTGRVSVRVDRRSGERQGAWGDFIAEVALRVPGMPAPSRWRYSVEVKNRADTASVRRALSLPRLMEPDPLYTSYYITERVGALLGEASISWLDTAGNYFLRMGEEVFERVGRRASGVPGRPPMATFAPKASRIARVLLSFPSRRWRTLQIAELVGLDAGYTSRILQALSKSGYVERRDSEWMILHPDRLLKDWAREYRFSRHDIEGFFSLTRRVEGRMDAIQASAQGKGRVAFTGAPAAGMWGVLAAVDQVVAYVESPRTRESIARSLRLSKESESPNVLLVVPDDAGVFIPHEERDGLNLVARPQLYLDTLAAPRGETLAHDFEEKLPWRN